MITLPELSSLGSGIGVIRIPELRNIPVTRRVQELIDHPGFQRLRRVRMLGPTFLVYPGASHSRFEHSLGVFDYVRQFLYALLRNQNLRVTLSEEDLLTVLAAGLVHDLGHYPFAHSLEALHLKGEDTPRHEEVGGQVIFGEFAPLRGKRSIAKILKEDWNVDPHRVIALCTGEAKRSTEPVDRVLHSIISGTIDADKMDYLERDSHHMGVPYGRTFDRERLLASLTLNESEDALAIDAKGKVPAEMFVFARYTMFSEVYWHHTVRAASAMVENAIAAFHSRDTVSKKAFLDLLLSYDDDSFLTWLATNTPENSATRFLIQGLLPGTRELYKRIATFSRAYVEPEKKKAYEKIYEMERAQLFDLTARLRVRLGASIGHPLHPAAVIIDIPPRDKDKLETIDVVYPAARGIRTYKLHDLSAVVAGIQGDFIAVVKKIRIFTHPHFAPLLRALPDLEEIILDEILSGP